MTHVRLVAALREKSRRPQHSSALAVEVGTLVCGALLYRRRDGWRASAWTHAGVSSSRSGFGPTREAALEALDHDIAAKAAGRSAA